MLHHRDGRWESVRIQSTADLHAVTMATHGQGWAAGAWGTILHFAGGTWTKQPTPVAETLRAVAQMHAGEAWAVGNQGRMLHFTDGVWRQAASLTGDDLYSVALDDAQGEGWAIGGTCTPEGTCSSTFLRYGGGIWSRIEEFGSFPPTAMDMAQGAGWAVGGLIGGTLYRLDADAWSTTAG